MPWACEGVIAVEATLKILGLMKECTMNIISSLAVAWVTF